MDQFAKIAESYAAGRMSLLHYPEPAAFQQVPVPLRADAAFEPLVPPAVARTAEELKAALAAMRRQYEPFLQNCAPAVANTRSRTPLTHFQWHQMGKEGSKTVTIPHYGEPLGAARTCYETSFTSNCRPGRRLYLVFKGADYRASVFVNGQLAGTHEGFFAAFEFDITALLRPIGEENALRVELENDYVMLGSTDGKGNFHYGDKLFACTGPGFDSPELGWHHCPPAMGLFDAVHLEERDVFFVSDLFTRTLDDRLEVWAEVSGADYPLRELSLKVSLYGANHPQTVVENLLIKPFSAMQIGLGDTFTETNARRDNTLGSELPLLCGKGRNRFVFSVNRENLRLWDLQTPFLYELQVAVLDEHQQVMDVATHRFGVRSFEQDTQPDEKTGLAGMFRLNGKPIRLRGANTMGFEQQDVMQGKLDQLIDDILLAKLCNMNFLRLTQRPVQQEVYEYCSKLGLMTQTDLPLFGVLRRERVAEALRQVSEMERHVRGHACNILVTYINEPFPNAHNRPQSNLNRPELEQFFAAADILVHLENPERVIKHVDGDYDPPNATMPDNHCYSLWYNGHGIDAGKLHKGYWLAVKPGWYYGCGEFGCEGLEDEGLMRRHYPPSWLPRSPEEDKTWRASSIVDAQTEDFYHYFYEKQHSLSDWIQESQRFQAFATRWMTEAFRRDHRMASFAVHLFIDAFPSGWMKTIMDCERRPKPAYFAYRDALAPVLLSLRSDRMAYEGGEALAIEAWLCNDTLSGDEGEIRYELYRGCTDGKQGLISGGKPCAFGSHPARLPANSSAYAGSPSFTLPQVTERELFVLKAYFVQDGRVVAANQLLIPVFPALSALDSGIGTAAADAGPELLAKKLSDVTSLDIERVKSGAVLYVDALHPGRFNVAGHDFEVSESGMSPTHFAARDTGHPWVNPLRPGDLSYLFDAQEDRIVPLAACTFSGDGFSPVLTSRNRGAGTKGVKGVWKEVMLMGELQLGRGYVLVSTIPCALLQQNPAGRLLLHQMLTSPQYQG